MSRIMVISNIMNFQDLPETPKTANPGSHRPKRIQKIKGGMYIRNRIHCHRTTQGTQVHRNPHLSAECICVCVWLHNRSNAIQIRCRQQLGKPVLRNREAVCKLFLQTYLLATFVNRREP